MNKNMYIQGDLVLHKGEVKAIKEPRDKNHFDLIGNGTNASACNIPIDEISGVELTQEILEKNGWKKRKNTYGYRKYCYKRQGYPKLNMASNSKFEFHFGDHDITITNVHELQHLLFGFGIDNEIKV